LSASLQLKVIFKTNRYFGEKCKIFFILALEKVEKMVDGVYLKYAQSITKSCPSPNNTYGNTDYTRSFSCFFDNRLDCENDLDKFQTTWNKGMPSLITNVSLKHDKKLWSRNAFLEICKTNRPKVIDCRSRNVCNKTTPEIFLSDFNRKAIYPKKIADWPATESFKSVFPKQYKDFMENVCLPMYSLPDGELNMVRYLPKDICNIPDLGPKLYIAHGSEKLDLTSTHLHKDMSDALNMCILVDESNIEIKEQDLQNEYLVCEGQINRYKKHKNKLAAIWHLFKAKDFDKIDMYILKKYYEQRSVTQKSLRKKTNELNWGSIHNQDTYLTKDDFARLNQVGVKPYAILQFEGDTIVLPAGLPHQVFLIKPRSNLD
jgi:[histone H3]-dimethyl-L-lysine9 demethylase